MLLPELDHGIHIFVAATLCATSIGITARVFKDLGKIHLPEAKVDIKGTSITVSSSNIEAAGQTAANLEKATRLTGRDRRIFQDGIFITEKPGRKI